jgi:hypothetical protein
MFNLWELMIPITLYNEEGIETIHLIDEEVLSYIEALEFNNEILQSTVDRTHQVVEENLMLTHPIHNN